MTTTSADARLVTAYLAGDRDALGALYDRFAPSLYDTTAAMLSDRHEAADVVQDVFLVAAERMGQLRDPERIKPWLFSIARHEIYRRTKRRSRVMPSEFVPDMAAPVDMNAEAEGLAYEELTSLVRDAASGLDERDQLVLELSVRQGLQGADLAAALGVTPEQSYTLVHRIRERVERTIGALVVARQGRKECDELHQVLLGWDGTFSVLWRKRVARHVDACETCERTRRKVAPLALFGAAPAFALPMDLRDRVLGQAGAGASSAGRLRLGRDGFPKAAGAGRRPLLWIGVAAVVAGLAAGGILLADGWGGGDDPAVEVADVAATTVAESTTSSTPVTTTAAAAPVTAPPVTAAPVTTLARTVPPTTAPRTVPPTTAPPTTPAPPGKLVVSTTAIDLGRTKKSAVVTLENTGGRSLQWTRSGLSPFSISGPTGGTLAPGQGVDLTVSFDRGSLAEGSFSDTLSIDGTFSAQVTVKARVERAPNVDIVNVNVVSALTCSTSIIYIEVAVTDEQEITSVKGSWSGPGGSASFALAGDGTLLGTITKVGGFGLGNGGDYTITVNAEDSRGNVGEDTSTFFVQTCPQ